MCYTVIGNPFVIFSGNNDTNTFLFRFIIKLTYSSIMVR